MDALPGYMFDTNVFNRIVDGVISLPTLTGRVVAYATHIQRDEINNTKNPERRAALAQVFGDVVAGLTPLIPSCWGCPVFTRLGWAVSVWFQRRLVCMAYRGTVKRNMALRTTSTPTERSSGHHQSKQVKQRARCANR